MVAEDVVTGKSAMSEPIVLEMFTDYV